MGGRCAGCFADDSIDELPTKNTFLRYKFEAGTTITPLMIGESWQMGEYVVTTEMLPVWVDKSPGRVVSIFYRHQTFVTELLEDNWAKVESGWVQLSPDLVVLLPEETRRSSPPCCRSPSSSLEKIQNKISENRKKFRGRKNKYIDKTDFLEVAGCGSQILHYENSPFPSEKVFKMNFAELTLTLGAERYFVEDIELVASGRCTPTLSKISTGELRDECFFSLVFGEFVLDLACQDQQLVETWISGLRSMRQHSPEMCEEMQEQLRRVSAFKEVNEELRRISQAGVMVPNMSQDGSTLEFLTQHCGYDLEGSPPDSRFERLQSETQTPTSFRSIDFSATDPQFASRLFRASVPDTVDWNLICSDAD